MTNGWTPERRKRQAELIKLWQPWNYSTGPKTNEGKEACKMNAVKHGLNGRDMRQLRQLLRQQRKSIVELQVGAPN